MAETGDILDGKYVLEDLLGSGGMGSVYRAMHLDLGKRFAIKVLQPDLVSEPTVLGRFQREARAAAKAGHPGIVEVYDQGQLADGSHYIVMELLQGHPLSALLDAAPPIAVERAAYISCQVLSALSAAHAAGVVHRDLKPENIFLIDVPTPSGVDVKLFDFGISRILDGEGSGAMSSLTKTGTIMGTPRYMSPEHARGTRDVDHRTDLYSMGVILFEALTGRPPFEADNYNALLISIVTEPTPSALVLREGLPPELDAVIAKAMSKDREQRYQTAVEMFEDLLPFVDGTLLGRVPPPAGAEGALERVRSGVHQRAEAETAEVVVPAVPERRSRWGLLAALGALGIVLVAGAMYGVAAALSAGGAGATNAPATAEPSGGAPLAPATAAGDGGTPTRQASGADGGGGDGAATTPDGSGSDARDDASDAAARDDADLADAREAAGAGQKTVGQKRGSTGPRPRGLPRTKIPAKVHRQGDGRRPTGGADPGGNVLHDYGQELD